MLPLFAPVLAQLITLGVADRTEGRYLVSYDERYEAATTPGVSLAFEWPRFDVSLAYRASLLLTPIESRPRELLVFNEASLGSSYHFGHTTLTLSSQAGFGDQNFQTAALRNPAGTQLTSEDDRQTEPADGTAAEESMDPPTPAGQTPAGASPPDAQPQTHVVNRAVRYGTSTSALQLTHQSGREVYLGVFAAYTIAGGLNDAEQRDYPLARGTTVGVQASHTLGWSARESFITDFNGQQLWSSNGNRATSVVGSEGWKHAFDKRTSGELRAGLSIVRFAQDDGLVAISVFPNFLAGLNHQTLLWRGTLRLVANAYSAPALDPLRATVDPRVGVGGSLGWARTRFSTAVAGSAAQSAAPAGNNAGAFDTYQASFVMGYRLADWVALDSGARLAQQQFQGATLVPLSYAVFVGLDLGYTIALHGAR